MQRCSHQDVQLDEIQWHIEEVHAHVEVPICIEMVRPTKHMQISDSVNEDEQNQQACRSRQSTSITADCEVLDCENSLENLGDKGHHHCPNRPEVPPEGEHNGTVVGSTIAIRPPPMVLGLAHLALARGNRDSSTTRSCRPTATTESANDAVRRVLLDHIRRMDHVELSRRILSSECEDCELATRMVLQEAGDIENLSVQHHPTIVFRHMLGNLLQGVPTGGLHGRWGSSRRRGSRLGLGLARHAPSQGHQAGLGDIGSQHVLRACTTSNPTERDAVQQRRPAQAVVAVHTTRNFTSCVKTRDHLLLGVHDL
mmetsp:Transcript_1622/g.3518  ORF Transcript_1622/g.3518 Transcript_1622/m.3518 type:complete len:312 (+) Transcript_1622:714-1649(+)